MDRIPEKVLDNVLSNLSVMDLFRLQVVSKAFKESCRRCLKSREKLIVCDNWPVDDRQNDRPMYDYEGTKIDMYSYLGSVFRERMRACGPEDAIRLELFKFNSKSILDWM